LAAPGNKQPLVLETTRIAFGQTRRELCKQRRPPTTDAARCISESAAFVVVNLLLDWYMQNNRFSLADTPRDNAAKRNYLFRE
jgi:hypothetical protein